MALGHQCTQRPRFYVIEGAAVGRIRIPPVCSFRGRTIGGDAVRTLHQVLICLRCIRQGKAGNALDVETVIWRSAFRPNSSNINRGLP
jgi:hypothetical protein